MKFFIASTVLFFASCCGAKKALDSIEIKISKHLSPDGCETVLQNIQVCFPKY